jgi:hypothetical protein
MARKPVWQDSLATRTAVELRDKQYTLPSTSSHGMDSLLLLVYYKSSPSLVVTFCRLYNKQSFQNVLQSLKGTVIAGRGSSYKVNTSSLLFMLLRACLLFVHVSSRQVHTLLTDSCITDYTNKMHVYGQCYRNRLLKIMLLCFKLRRQNFLPYKLRRLNAGLSNSVLCHAQTTKCTIIDWMNGAFWKTGKETEKEQTNRPMISEQPRGEYRGK